MPLKPTPRGAKKPNSLRWQIRKNPEIFRNWWTKLDCHTLFFDGSSKRNPRVTSVGGVIFYPGGNKQKDFAWGLGKSTNNHVEWLALLKGLEIVITLGV